MEIGITDKKALNQTVGLFIKKHIDVEVKINESYKINERTYRIEMKDFDDKMKVLAKTYVLKITIT